MSKHLLLLNAPAMVEVRPVVSRDVLVVSGAKVNRCRAVEASPDAAGRQHHEEREVRLTDQKGPHNSRIPARSGPSNNNGRREQDQHGGDLAWRDVNEITGQHMAADGPVSSADLPGGQPMPLASRFRGR